MKKFVWLIGLLLDLCDAANFGCCGIKEGVCMVRNDFDSSYKSECPPGYSGDKCNIKCVYPWYGRLCGSSCSNDPNNCSRDDCHPALGCQSHGLQTSTTLNKDSQVGTSEFIQRHREETINGSGLFTNMPIGSSRKQTNHVVTRPMATIYINTSAREFQRLTLRRRGSLSGKSMTVSQPSEQEFRLLSARSHQNVDRGLVASSNSINNPPVYQDHSKIVRLSEADSMGETESVRESRNTIVYMHKRCLSVQNTDHTTSVDNPYYDEIGSNEA
uniref:EGF-like domain-containing protein n=1 Tax=Magallana gigas TaxID=29159 RepID=A0A8W8JYP5_MAGGI